MMQVVFGLVLGIGSLYLAASVALADDRNADPSVNAGEPAIQGMAAIIPLTQTTPLTDTTEISPTVPSTTVNADAVIYLPTIYGRYPNPTSPTSPYPRENLIDVSVNTFLAWTSRSLDDKKITYEIYLDANDDVPTTLIGTNAIDNFSPGSLNLGTQYYWQIVAVDEDGRRARGPVWTFRTQDEIDTPDTDATVFVPAGYFRMGCDSSNPAEQACQYGDTHMNAPLRTVYLDGFAIDQFEVTNREYRACVEAGACSPPRQTNSYRRRSYYHNSDYDDYPVVYVSWWDAQDYCAWEGKRLPTDAEWEKAARGPLDTRIWPWGNEEYDCGRLLYPEDRSCNVEQDTVRVGSYPRGASPYNVMDVAGNVFEWVQDRYDVRYYTYAPTENPQGPDISRPYLSRADADQPDYPIFTLRGGSFRDSPYYRYVSHRHWGHWGDVPMHDIPLFRNDKVGFRCAVSVE